LTKFGIEVFKAHSGNSRAISKEYYAEDRIAQHTRSLIRALQDQSALDEPDYLAIIAKTNLSLLNEVLA